MMAVRRIRAERSPNRAAHLRQEHNTLLARMPPDTMRTGLARAAARGIQACGQTVAHFFGTKRRDPAPLVGAVKQAGRLRRSVLRNAAIGVGRTGYPAPPPSEP